MAYGSPRSVILALEARIHSHGCVCGSSGLRPRMTECGEAKWANSPLVKVMEQSKHLCSGALKWRVHRAVDTVLLDFCDKHRRAERSSFARSFERLVP